MAALVSVRPAVSLALATWPSAFVSAAVRSSSRSPSRCVLVLAFTSLPAARACAALWARRLGVSVSVRRGAVVTSVWFVSLPCAGVAPPQPLSWFVGASSLAAGVSALSAAVGGRGLAA